MKKVITVLILVIFIFLVIANIIYAGKEHAKVINDSHVLEEEVNILKEHNETIMELVHEEFIPKEKFTKVIDSLNVEITYKDSTIKETKKIVRNLRKQKTPPPSPQIHIPQTGVFHDHDSLPSRLPEDTLESDTLLFNE